MYNLTKITAPGGAFDVIKTALFDDSESEGSGGYPGDNDFDTRNEIVTKIVPTKTLTEKPTVESSPSYPPPKPREPVIVTSPLPNPALTQPPIVQKKLQKHAVVAGRALKIQV